MPVRRILYPNFAVSFEIAWTWDVQNAKILIVLDCVKFGHI